MEKQIIQVKEFQEAFGVVLPKRPKLLPKKRSEFRHKLLEEEVSEIKQGAISKDIVQVADGVIDSMYILIGTAHEYGFADRLVMLFDEVHRSNMSKMGPDGKAIFREDGKVMKPETYSAPKLQPIIDRDFSIYNENEILQEIAVMQKTATEIKIRSKIISGLNIFDRILFYLSDKIESRLKKKVEVKFPIKGHDPIHVIVNGKVYEVY
jgi:predicted HAD superfamily Cof-like phosphohydrolase